MIIRTYQRRSRSGRSASDSGSLYGDGVGSSSQESAAWGSSQEPAPISFASSQESGFSQSDHGNSNRFSRSFRRESQEENFGDDNAKGMFSRPSVSGSFHQSPVKNFGDGTESKGKLKRANTEKSSFFSNGTKGNSSRDLGRSDPYEIEFHENGAKRASARAEGGSNSSLWTAPSTSTLMEAQESGELMEHVDEANFALDGLKPGQPVRIQRASLTSILSLCGSWQRRRMLRTQGMAKPLLDAIIALPTDDPPLALAAAAVLYVLAIDSPDENLLDSEPCALFLLKLLGAQSSQPVVKKGISAIGSRLAALSKSTANKVGANLVSVDREATVLSKVRDLFKTLQEHGSAGANPSEENGMLPGEQISSKWLALRTLEKACVSTVVLEDDEPENVRKVGGRFKERLRELGGLDTVCELAASCLVNLTDTLNAKDGRRRDESGGTLLERNEKAGGAGVLLRCLRIMENVTFFSEKNQKHLLELKLSKGKVRGTDTFIGLTINVINTLSELLQRQKDRKEGILVERDPVGNGVKERSTPKLSPIREENSSSSASKGKRQRSLMDCFRPSDAADETRESEKAYAQRIDKGGDASVRTFKRRKSSMSSSLTQDEEDLESSHDASSIPSDAKRAGQASRKMGSFSDLKAKSGRSKQRKSFFEDSQDPFASDFADPASNNESKPQKSGNEDSQDPFSFDDVDMDFQRPKEPKRSKRESAGKSDSVGMARKLGPIGRLASKEENVAVLRDSDSAEKSAGSVRADSEKRDEEGTEMALFGNCLLSGVKVLMNLTNGNPAGCAQVAACGGLDSLSILVLANYPWPKSPDKVSGDKKPFASDRNEDESEHDLDLLVAVLGLLCNLVEKDISNRAILANLKVTIPADIASTKEGKLWEETGVIGVLCSLFLLKQGAGEAAEAMENKKFLEVHEEVKQEAEDMIVEAYTALLLAFLSKASERARRGIARLLPDDNLKSLVPVLERFLAFHMKLHMISEETHDVVVDVINSCKEPIG